MNALARNLRLLEAGKALGDTDLEALWHEIEGLDLERCVTNPVLTLNDAEARLSTLPLLSEDSDAKRLRICQGVSRLLRPAYLDRTEETREEEPAPPYGDDDNEEAEGLVLSAAIDESAVVTSGAKYLATSDLLTQEEEQYLLVVFNYARQRLMQSLPTAVTLEKLRLCDAETLLVCINWTIRATEARNYLVEFHYPFVIKIAFRVKEMIRHGIEVADLFTVGVDGLNEAINAFDATKQKGSARLVRFAPRCVAGAMLEWFDRQTGWTATSKVARRGGNAGEHSPEGVVRREKIPFSEVLFGLVVDGWSIVSGKYVEGSEASAESILGSVRLPEDALKLEQYVTFAQLRKAAAVAGAELNPAEAFKQFETAVRETSPVCGRVVDAMIDSDFAPTEWRLVWRRRALCLWADHHPNVPAHPPVLED